MNRLTAARIGVAACALVLGIAASVAFGQGTTTTTTPAATSTVPGDYQPATIPNTATFEENSSTVPDDDESSQTGGAGGSKDPDAAGNAGENAGAGAGGSAPVGASSLPGSLASTGTEPFLPIGVGAALIALSGFVLLRRRRQT